MILKNCKVFFTLFLLLGVNVGIFSQTKVTKYYANKDNNYGVVYTLPKSLIQVCLSVRETKYTPGIFSEYSKIYTDKYAETKEYNKYDIISSGVSSVGVIDTTKRFLVAFDKNTVAPFVNLTNTGIISSINANETDKEDSILPFYTEWTKCDKQLPSLPETYFSATDKMKKAEIASKYMSSLKQSVVDLLTGDMENMPKDGEGIKLIMDRLNVEIKRVERLFWGDTISRIQNIRVYIEPTSEDINNRTVLRFSNYYGVVSNIDMSGEPIKLDVKIVDRYPSMEDKEREKFLRKLDGIVYNMPATGKATLRYDGEILCEGDIAITQAGTMQTLREDMFNIKNKKPIQVLFDINSGAIRNIKEQE